MKDMLKALLSSKKFCAMLVGMLAAVGTRFLGLDEAQANEVSMQIVGLAGTFVLGQGIADHGKERAKVTAGKV